MGKINKRNVDKLSASGGRPTFLWDDHLSGFAVKCLPSGAKRYVVKYRAGSGGRSAQQRWLTLGAHGQLTPDQARKLAQQVLAAVARGEDPQASKLQGRRASTMADLWNRFEKEHLPNKKPRTRHDYYSQWLKILEPSIGRTAIATVSRGDVDRLHKSLRSTPYRANRVLALLSRLMNLAEAWELRPLGSNPCKHVERYRETPRARYLNAQELERLGETIRTMVDRQQVSQDAANAVRLLLLTGARLNEILSAKWEWVRIEERLIALPDSKGGARPVFLSDAAVRILQDQKSRSKGHVFIFPGPGAEGRMVNLRKPWKRICEQAGLQGVRLHDLRHTAASVAVGQGTSLPIIGRLLGHTQAQTTQRYAHVDTDPALQAANVIGGALDRIMNGVKS